MRKAVALVPLVALLVAGCTTDASTGPVTGMDGEGTEYEQQPASSADDPIASGAEQPGHRLPPAGPRADEVWRGEYACVSPPQFGCTTNRHPFEVTAMHGAITATVTLTTPGGSACCNGVQVRLIAPDGTYAWSGYGQGAHHDGEQAVVGVDDPRMLAQPGTWQLTVSTVDLAVAFATYEARVSFQAHADHASPQPTGPPRALALNATWYTGVNVPVEWARIDAALPEGLEPAGYPGDPLFNQPCCTPEGTVAPLLGILVDYEEAWIDEENLPSGRLALALTVVKPDPGHDIGTLRNWAIIAAAATDERLVHALDSWGFDASIGTIDMTYSSVAGDMDIVSSNGRVVSDRLAFTMQVHGQSAFLGTFGMGDPPQEIGNWGVRDGTAGPPLVYHLPGHNQRGGPGIMTGHFGALGDVAPAGGIGSAATWFGTAGGSPLLNDPGLLLYEVHDEA